MCASPAPVGAWRRLLAGQVALPEGEEPGPAVDRGVCLEGGVVVLIDRTQRDLERTLALISHEVDHVATAGGVVRQVDQLAIAGIAELVGIDPVTGDEEG